MLSTARSALFGRVVCMDYLLKLDLITWINRNFQNQRRSHGNQHVNLTELINEYKLIKIKYLRFSHVCAVTQSESKDSE